MSESAGALTQLRAWLAQRELGENTRLPPERELCALLGVSRGDLRKGLEILEREGVIWRRVGKGTFLGIPPADETWSLSSTVERSSPAEVMRARIKLEPALAFEAALHATKAHLEEMRRCINAGQAATTWREYETCDNRFHKTVAEATGNTVLTALFDQLNAVRRAVVWKRERTGPEGPPADHHSHAEHRRIFDAIASRDAREAEAAMRAHIEKVSVKLLQVAAEAEVE
ncbi:GntR family transcriptional regulator [Rhodobacteraceae bacterium WD3A24]|nr:GntR family transcriptional regulator [Rhodobacteraceae bacterium WD3A24]